MPHKRCVGDGPSTVTKRNTASFGQFAHLAQHTPFVSQRQRADHIDPHTPKVRDQFTQLPNRRRVIRGGVRCGTGAQRGEAANGCCRAHTANRLSMFFARLSQVGVEIGKTRCDDTATSVNYFHVRPDGFAIAVEIGQIVQSFNFAVGDQNITDSCHSVGRIDNCAVFYEIPHRFHLSTGHSVQ